MTVQGRKYIGQAKDVGKRLSRHMLELYAHKHPNPHLQSVYDLCGEESFTFELLEECLAEDLLEREVHHISQVPASELMNILAPGHMPAWRENGGHKAPTFRERIQQGMERARKKGTDPQERYRKAIETKKQRAAENPEYYNRGRREYRLSEEGRAARTGRMEESRPYMLSRLREKCSKYHVLMNVENQEVSVVHNFAEFCRQQGLKENHLRRTRCPQLRDYSYSHKKWKYLGSFTEKPSEETIAELVAFSPQPR